LLFQNSEAAENRQAGVLQNRELPREGGHHLRAGAADGKRLASLAPLFLGGRLARFLDGDLGDVVAHLANRRLGFRLVGRFDDVADLLPSLIHRFELICRHGVSRLARVLAGVWRTSLFGVLSVGLVADPNTLPSPLYSGERGKGEGASG